MSLLSDLSAWGSWLFAYLVPFLFVLTIVVFFHELGHFLVARWAGVKVLTFSLGFGPELVGLNDRHGARRQDRSQQRRRAGGLSGRRRRHRHRRQEDRQLLRHAALRQRACRRHH